MNKNELIGLRILALRAAGVGMRTAIDTVLGTGTFDKLVSEVYDTLRTKAGQ